MSKHRHRECDCCDCKDCKGKKKERCPEVDCCPEVKLECCESMPLGHVRELDATHVPVLMQGQGDDTTERRKVRIKACVSAFATDDVPATANFQLRLDGELVGSPFSILLEELQDDAAEPCAEKLCTEVLVDVGPGRHTAELLAWSDELGVNLEPSSGGCPCTFLEVCTVAKEGH